MSGVVGLSSIRLAGKILGKEVDFLMDTGATHNFIDLVTGLSSIRLVGRILGKEVGFLVDTRATHNFIDLEICQLI